MKLRPFVFIPAFVLGFGCSSSHTNEPTTPTTTTPVDANVSTLSNSQPATEPDASVTPAEPPPAPVAIEPGTRRDVPAPTPRVRITAPTNNRTLTTNRVEVRLAVEHWRDVHNPNDHRHIHLVLDNQPYRRIDDPTRPIVLENLSPGRHVLRAFPGWETHETVKTPGAYAMVVFNVGRLPAGTPAFNPRAPLLTYSRPHGSLTGPASDRILLDWYLSGITPDNFGPNGYRVRPRIDGTDLSPLTTWAPHYITNLPDGDHTISLTLLGPDGQPVPGPLNTVEQHLSINRHPAPTAPTATTATPTPTAPSDPHAGH